MTSLISLSVEIKEQIVDLLPRRSLSALGSTCRALYDICHRADQSHQARFSAANLKGCVVLEPDSIVKHLDSVVADEVLGEYIEHVEIKRGPTPWPDVQYDNYLNIIQSSGFWMATDDGQDLVTGYSDPLHLLFLCMCPNLSELTMDCYEMSFQLEHIKDLVAQTSGHSSFPTIGTKDLCESHKQRQSLPKWSWVLSLPFERLRSMTLLSRDNDSGEWAYVFMQVPSLRTLKIKELEEYPEDDWTAPYRSASESSFFEDSIDDEETFGVGASQGPEDCDCVPSSGVRELVFDQSVLHEGSLSYILGLASNLRSFTYKWQQTENGRKPYVTQAWILHYLAENCSHSLEELQIDYYYCYRLQNHWSPNVTLRNFTKLAVLQLDINALRPRTIFLGHYKPGFNMATRLPESLQSLHLNGFCLRVHEELVHTLLHGARFLLPALQKLIIQLHLSNAFASVGCKRALGSIQQLCNHLGIQFEAQTRRGFVIDPVEYSFSSE